MKLISNTFFAFAVSIILLASSGLQANDSVTPESTTSANNAEQVQQVININTANLQQLTSLKGIGESKAKAIIAYRESNGAFADYGQLLKVKGIGLKIIQSNEQRITFK